MKYISLTSYCSYRYRWEFGIYSAHRDDGNGNHLHLPVQFPARSSPFEQSDTSIGSPGCKHSSPRSHTWAPGGGDDGDDYDDDGNIDDGDDGDDDDDDDGDVDDDDDDDEELSIIMIISLPMF